MEEEGELDSLDIVACAVRGDLWSYLSALQPTRWARTKPGGNTLLASACMGNNTAAVAALLAHGVRPTVADDAGWTAAHLACMYAQPRALDMLCSASADLNALTSGGLTPLGIAVLYMPRSAPCIRVLVANGVRLSAVSVDYRHHITLELEAFERGVLRCRAVVVAMLRVKRVSGQLVRWDKFLLLELAVCAWATRYAPEWAKALD